MLYTILGIFCSFFNWDGADIQPQIGPRKIPVTWSILLRYCVVGLLTDKHLSATTKVFLHFYMRKKRYFTFQLSL